MEAMQTSGTGYAQVISVPTPSVANDLGAVRDTLVDLVRYARERLAPYLVLDEKPDGPTAIGMPTADAESACNQAAELIAELRAVLAVARL